VNRAHDGNSAQVRHEYADTGAHASRQEHELQSASHKVVQWAQYPPMQLHAKQVFYATGSVRVGVQAGKYGEANRSINE
jgi:hypothetical protein